MVKQDLAISIEVMLEMTRLLESRWLHSASNAEHSMLANVGCYIVIAFCGSFRVAEVFLVDLLGLKKYATMDFRYNDKDYVIIPLLGRFKNELGLKYHLNPLAGETSSGIKVKSWVQRLIEVRIREERHHGPAFVNESGIPLPSNDIEEEVINLLLEIQERNKILIPSEVNVQEEYGISRSFW